MTPIHASPSGFESVATLLPAFDFEGLIAYGDSSSIFKARHRSLDRDVAIKIIPRTCGTDHSEIAGAKVMAGLNHPNLIRVYDSGEAGDFHYVVMEYVPGKSLEHCAGGRAIEPRQASGIIIAACEGLAHAHDNGVIHGAIDASNIMLNPKCEPKIGNFANTPCADGNSSPQNDVFALGLILRELLTGVSRDSANAATAIVPDMKLAMICRKATHLDPERRYPDATALGEALTRAIMPVENTPPVRKTQTSPLQRPKQALAVSGGYQRGSVLGKCAVIAFLLFSICGVWAFGQAKQERISRLQKEEDAKPKVIVVRAAQPAGESNTALVRWER
jgi:serine/threonine protein kinase